MDEDEGLADAQQTDVAGELVRWRMQSKHVEEWVVSGE